MKAAFLLCALAACATGSGSGYTYKLVPEANAQPQPKPADCTFQVVTSPPQGRYVTLGTLTPTDFPAPTLDDLHRSIQAQVCQLGGEIVIGTQATDGTFHKAIVLRSPSAQPPAGSAAP